MLVEGDVHVKGALPRAREVRVGDGDGVASRRAVDGDAAGTGLPAGSACPRDRGWVEGVGVGGGAGGWIRG